MSRRSKVTLPEFEPVDGSRLSRKDAIVVGTRLSQIEAASGAITPAAVLEDARQKSSPLHGFFQWDDAKAAEEQRLNQARQLIRSVRIVVKDDGLKEPISVRAFVHLARPTTDLTEGGYVGTTKAMSNAEHRYEVVQTALSEMQALLRKYNHLHELSAVASAVEETRQRLAQRKTG